MSRKTAEPQTDRSSVLGLAHIAENGGCKSCNHPLLLDSGLSGGEEAQSSIQSIMVVP